MNRRPIAGACALLMAALISACMSSEVPKNWRDIKFPTAGFVRVEEDTDENGLYLEYEGVRRETLFAQIEAALVAAGYSKHGEAFDGNVVGYVRGDTKVAVKVDNFLGPLWVAIFNEKGKEPMLHGVVFGRYTLGPPREAKDELVKTLDDLDKEEKPR